MSEVLDVDDFKTPVSSYADMLQKQGLIGQLSEVGHDLLRDRARKLARQQKGSVTLDASQVRKAVEIELDRSDIDSEEVDFSEGELYHEDLDIPIDGDLFLFLGLINGFDIDLTRWTEYAGDEVIFDDFETVDYPLRFYFKEYEWDETDEEWQATGETYWVDGFQVSGGDVFGGFEQFADIVADWEDLDFPNLSLLLPHSFHLKVGDETKLSLTNFQTVLSPEYFMDDMTLTVTLEEHLYDQREIVDPDDGSWSGEATDSPPLALSLNVVKFKTDIYGLEAEEI